jgi:phosphoribosyl 1,2-cyclic phosphodiesterase
MTTLTAPSIPWEDSQPVVETYQAGTGFTIGDITVQSFTIPHDAIDPVGYTLHAQGLKIGVATDLGYMPDSIKWHLRDCDLLVLESNHDLEMLKVGPYPWSVKQRVMGRKGHLSNDLACEFIAESLDSRTTTLVLGHLSEQNNHPEIVRLVANQALEHRGLSTRLVVAEPRRPSEVFQL